MRPISGCLGTAVLSLLPVLALAQDWPGPYAAVTLSGNTADYSSFETLGVKTFDLEGTTAGLAAGYNLQTGNWVLGGEVAYSAGEIALNVYPANNYLDGMLELKARVGYAPGKLLWYGTLGWARSDRYYAAPVTNDPVPASAITYGLGLEAMLTERLFAGVEVQRRELEIDKGEIGGFPENRDEYDLQTATLRLGVRF